MIVRSAVKDVSNTRSKPMPAQRGHHLAVHVRAGLEPNSSASVTETAGACCTTTILFGIGQRRDHLARGSECSLSAPVGQTRMHWPQLMQLETFRPCVERRADERLASRGR